VFVLVLIAMMKKFAQKMAIALLMIIVLLNSNKLGTCINGFSGIECEFILIY
jgi:hypothetical protein